MLNQSFQEVALIPSAPIKMIKGKEALHYKKLKNKVVQCQLCPWFCTLKDTERGKCGVRENRDGLLYTLVYSRPCALNIDPIEKKPLYHFLPGSKSFSIGTAGCNLFCENCQNYTTSRSKPEDVLGIILQPEDVVKHAVKQHCQSISYTYNEPTIFYEYALDISRLAKKERIKNVMVTNGYINENPLKQLYKNIDAANVDLKGFSEAFYKKVCGARLKPVLDSLKAMKKMNIWLEVTNLVIPNCNDNVKEIKNMCLWIKKNLGVDTPLHFSRFYPYYKMVDVTPTPLETLEKAYDIARNAGMKFVYLGNVHTQGYSDTLCPKCGELLIKRGSHFSVTECKLNKGRCSRCNEKIPGVW